MAEQIITKEYLNELFEYRDGQLYWKFKKSPSVNINKPLGYVANKDRYSKVTINRKSYKLHRIIFLFHKGYLPDYIDHINGNSFDNRIENLRETTYSGNNQNAKTRKDSSSNVKGVYFHKLTNKWTASCQSNKKRYYLGLFDTIEEAEKVVKCARNDLHGEFARHH